MSTREQTLRTDPARPRVATPTPTRAPGRVPAWFASPFALLGVAVLTFLLRLPYLRVPLTSDEGGYLLIVRQWAPGRSDYGNYFMDRPPVLVVWYQLVDVLSGALGVLGATRTVGSIAAALTVLGAGLAARRFGGVRAGLAAAVLTGAMLATPLVGSVATDGELLAAPFVAFGIFLAVVAVEEPGTEQSRRAALFAGVCAALAFLVKQNMFDVLVFSGVLALAAWRTGRLSFAQVRVLATSLLAGTATTTLAVLAYAALHGTSPSEVAYAMFGFRMQAAHTLVEVTSSYRWPRLTAMVARGLASGALLLVVLVWALVRRRTGARGSLRFAVSVAVAVQAVFVAVAVMAGGAFWSHYFVQYAVPCGLAAGLLVGAVPQLTRRLLAPCVAVCLVGWMIGSLWPPHSDAVRVGDAIERSALPGDTMVSLLGDPVITEAAGMTTPYDQLWSLAARAVDPDLRDLRDVLAGPQAPTWVVVRGPETLARIRASAADVALASRYHVVAQMCDRIVLLRDGVARPAPEVPAGCHTSAGDHVRVPHEVH